MLIPIEKKNPIPTMNNSEYNRLVTQDEGNQ